MPPRREVERLKVFRTDATTQCWASHSEAVAGAHLVSKGEGAVRDLETIETKSASKFIERLGHFC